MVAGVKTHDVHGCYHLRSHGEDIAQAVGGGDLPIDVGIVHHRCDHIQGLHQSPLVIQTIDRRIFAAADPHDQSFIIACQIRQDM